MAIRDQPARRFREVQGIDRRRRQREQKQPQQTNGTPKVHLPHPNFPIPSPSHPSLLPPPTLMLPYPVFLPIPLPLFLPIPVKPVSTKETQHPKPQYHELDLCEGKRSHSKGLEANTADVGDNEAPLIVDIKQEEDSEEVENCETVIVEAEEGPDDPALQNLESLNPNKKNRKPRTRDEEVRRKRRALIMDR
eukprot:TRINITY_DN39247_c0_g1_i1.p1 TRINITY_DN39247_c0_g1~~TRINITY_DN39247_c0_g1_i1.p1  ORF type:complete len:192 (-),score=46.16 TRINITY_DN39247_c0_g1_i1:65-640(-)